MTDKKEPLIDWWGLFCIVTIICVTAIIITHMITGAEIPFLNTLNN